MRLAPNTRETGSGFMYVCVCGVIISVRRELILWSYDGYLVMMCRLEYTLAVINIIGLIAVYDIFTLVVLLSMVVASQAYAITIHATQ